MIKPTPRDDLTGVVLAGGRSRRMGRDKARLLLQGEPLIARAVRRLQAAARWVMVVAAWPATYAFVGVPCIPDIEPDQGPLVGLWSAAWAAHTPYLALVACDMPFLNPALLLAMTEDLEAHHADAVVPVVQGILHPLHAVYRREAVLRHVPVLYVQGERRPRGLLERIRTRYWDETRWRALDPEGRAFWNANTPEAWRRLREAEYNSLAQSKIQAP